MSPHSNKLQSHIKFSHVLPKSRYPVLLIHWDSIYYLLIQSFNNIRSGKNRLSRSYYLPHDEAILIESFGSSPGTDRGIFGGLAGPDGSRRAQNQLVLPRFLRQCYRIHSSNVISGVLVSLRRRRSHQPFKQIRKERHFSFFRTETDRQQRQTEKRLSRSSKPNYLNKNIEEKVVC